MAAPPLAAPLGEHSTLEEWLADDRGRALLTASSGDGAGSILKDEETLKVIGSFPMSSLAFGQLGWSRAQLDEMIARL